MCTVSLRAGRTVVKIKIYLAKWLFLFGLGDFEKTHSLAIYFNIIVLGYFRHSRCINIVISSTVFFYPVLKNQHVLIGSVEPK